MKKARRRFQKGSVRLVPRANDKTAWEYRYTNPTTGHKDSMYLSTEEYPTSYLREKKLQGHSGEIIEMHPHQDYENTDSLRTVGQK